MVSKNKGFYIMKDPSSGYVKHRSKNGDISSKFVLLDYPASHDSVGDSFYYISLDKTKNYKPKVKKSVKSVSTSQPQSTQSRVVRTVTVGSSSSSSSSSGSSGSSGGGY
tara:strand:- start:160 stop:486 length:327 start_codon:yes stop_codon:yes gene_type:complete